MCTHQRLDPQPYDGKRENWKTKTEQEHARAFESHAVESRHFDLGRGEFRFTEDSCLVHWAA
jgi:hypothetical protein